MDQHGFPDFASCSHELESCGFLVFCLGESDQNISTEETGPVFFLEIEISRLGEKKIRQTPGHCLAGVHYFVFDFYFVFVFNLYCPLYLHTHTQCS